MLLSAISGAVFADYYEVINDTLANPTLYGSVYANEKYIFVGEGGSIYYSINATQWTKQPNKSYKVYYIAVINEAEAPISSIENNLNDLADLKPNQNSPRQRLTESLKKYDVKDSTEQPMFFDCIEVWNNYEFSLKI